MKHRDAVLGLLLSVAGHQALALSLGSPRGAVTLGQPLDLLFDVQAESGEDPGTSCNRAEVVLGDSRLDGARVRQTPVTNAQGRVTAVRVQTTSAVDEPVAIVRLSVGCDNRITRSYTLLSQLPETVARPGSPVPIPFATGAAPRESVPARAATLPASPAAAAVAATEAPPPVPPRRARQATDSSAPASAAPAPVVRAPAAATPPTPRAPARGPAVAESRPRLALDPLEDWLGTPGTLRLTDGLAQVPPEEASAQRTQAAALWKALNASPEDVLRDSTRLQALEAEARTLRAAAAREKAAAAELQTRLDQQQSEGFGSTVVYVLGLLLALALALAAWLFARSRRADQARKDWWQFKADATSDTAVVADVAAPAVAVADDITAPVPIAPAEPRRATAAVPPPSGVHGIDVDLANVEAAASAFSHFTLTPDDVDVQGARVVNPEELFDVRQHADFFVSLGQYEQAIEVLEKHIASYAESSPLAYLDLLHIFHTLSRVEDYSRLAQRFGEHFNGIVPPFTDFNRPTYGIEDYPEVLRALERVWGTSTSAAQLEGHLVRRPGVQRAAGPFALDAYRDLLLLYAVALDAGYGTAQPVPAAPEQPVERPVPPPPAPIPRPVDAPSGHQRDSIDGLTVESGLLDLEPLEPSLQLDIDPPSPPPAPLPPVASPDIAAGNLIDFDLDEEIEAGLARNKARSKPPSS